MLHKWKSLYLKYFLIWVSASLIFGCSSLKKELYCKVSEADIDTLQINTHQFLEAKWGKKEAACENITKSITYLSKFGCAIYGLPKKGDGCPDVTDGDYWVSFDKKH